MKRRNFSADFKAKVAKVALRNDQTVKEIASQFEIHPIMVSKWKKLASEGLVSVFEDKRILKKTDDKEEETKRLYEEIGKLKMQLDWLKKKCGIES
jgi:transposase-like protein